MTADDIRALLFLYLIVAVLVSIFAAQFLERRLKARLPATRPYRWGFYVGCMGLTCAPLSLVTALATLMSGMRGDYEVAGECAAYTLFLTLHIISGWFVVQRKQWAWIVSTILSCNLIAWMINYIYGRNRWAEFAG